MEKIIRILMRRDEMTRKEAEEYVKDTMTEIQSAIDCGDYCLAEDIFESDLGLEPDYLIDLLLTQGGT